MGFDAEKVKQMSMWEFSAQMIGWSRQYEQGMSAAEKDELWGWLQAKGDVPAAHRKAN